MGAWGKGSQWCNRLLGIFVDPERPVLFWERECEAGGDEASLAEEQITRWEGAGGLFLLRFHAQVYLVSGKNPTWRYGHTRPGE